MVTYLLLRDNKQIGPFTLDELTQKGLKAYDLVWVEGKSAAWRYPSEIEELKSFAPIIEEQPFDRFYKRPATETKNNIPKEVNQIKTEPPAVSYEKHYASISRADNKIYVTLPARNATVAAAPAPVIKKNPVEEVVQSDMPKNLVHEEKFAKPTNFGHEFLQRDVAEKDQRVEKKQQTGIALNQKILKPAMVVLSVLLLLGSGILIGLYLNKNSILPAEKKKVTAVEPNTPPKDQPSGSLQTNTKVLPVSDQLVDNSSQNNPVNNPASDNSAKSQENKIQNKNAAVSSAADGGDQKKEQTALEDKKQAQKAKSNLPKKVPIVALSPSTDSNSDFYQRGGIAKRSATHRDDEISDKAVLKTNVAEMVGLSANKYSVGTFGGISNLEITVSNHSVYPLDLVVVEVQYVQANKKIFKTENVYFHNVGAGSALMLEAPKSPRGIKVQYKIALINSKESGISYSGN